MRHMYDDLKQTRSIGLGRCWWMAPGVLVALPLSAQQVVLGTPSGGANSNVCSQAAGSASYSCLSQTVGGGTALISGAASPAQSLDASAQGVGTIAIGDTTTSAGSQGDIAIGAGAQSNGSGIPATAVGAGAVAGTTGAVALGSSSTASGEGSIAVGNGASAANVRGVYVGVGAGMGSSASGTDNVGIGSSAGANVSGYDNSAVGARAGSNVTGTYNMAFGTDSGNGVTGTANSAYGTTAGYHIVGDNNLAAGVEAGSNLNGSNNVALGAFAGDGQSSAPMNDTVAIGNSSVVGSSQAVAIGSNSVANGAQSVALGNNAIASAPGSVAIGSGAVTTAATPTAGITLNGVYYAFAGAKPTSVVSVGSTGAERQVTNVAAGQVSATSTDAVNGSQLYATNQAVSRLVSSADAALSSAENYTNSRLAGLDVEVNGIQRDADAGTASAMALAGVPQAFLPGKSMLGAGVGTYGNQSAFAIGLSTLTDDGRWVVKLNGTANTRGKYGGAVGAGISW